MNNKCQIFTPYENVIDLLDKVGYTHNLQGKKVLENSCGDGNILVEIVNRYVAEGISKGYSLSKIADGLEEDICGTEIDIKYFDICIKKLDKLILNFGMRPIKWKIENIDALVKNWELRFDFVIGNPPYITYQELPVDTRDFLRNKYITCSKGKFDYCYAFIEEGINSLSENGKLSFLIPNSVFKNVFGVKLRELMLPIITDVYDFTTLNLFNNALTSSAIIVLDKTKEVDTFIYHDIANDNEEIIEKSKLTDKWIFFKTKDTKARMERFGNYFKASNSVATLLNEVFIFNEGISEIEDDIIRKAASPRGYSMGKSEKIIFPYYYNENNELCKYDKYEFETKFPKAYSYLKKYKKRLLNRKSDKGAMWYEYGRSQALAHINKEKLLISSLVTHKVNVYRLSKSIIPYSGFYIISTNSLDLDIAIRILESKSFLEYTQKVGINANGSSIRISVKDINNFEFRTTDYLEG